MLILLIILYYPSLTLSTLQCSIQYQMKFISVESTARRVPSTARTPCSSWYGTARIHVRVGSGQLESLNGQLGYGAPGVLRQLKHHVQVGSRQPELIFKLGVDSSNLCSSWEWTARTSCSSCPLKKKRTSNGPSRRLLVVIPPCPFWNL